MRFIGNVLWLILYLGIIDALVCYLLGILLVLTVVGAPVGLGWNSYKIWDNFY